MRFLSIFLLCLITQSALSQQTKVSFRLMELMSQSDNSNKTISVLIKGDFSKIAPEIEKVGGHVKFHSGNICSASITVASLRTLKDVKSIERMEEGRIQVQTLNDKMLINNRIDLIHQGVSPLIQGYDGTNVVVGIIDTGIDFTHPDFKDSLGQSRILWIWDHLLANAGNTPQPYNYGQEFSKGDIDAGNANSHIDQTAHGTHVTGIAVANGDTLIAFKGAAPKADIIAVSLDFNQADDTWLSSIVDAVNYIFNKADSLNKPCVINISAGTYLGSHDGKDLQAVAIDNLIQAKDGRMVVAAAGNAGNYPLHIQHQLNADSSFTWFKKTSANPIFIEFWADTADLNNVQFTLGADQSTPYFEDRGQKSWKSISNYLGILGVDTLWSYSGNRIAIFQTYGQLIGNRYSMTYVIIPDSTTYFFRLMSKGTGKFDSWSFELVSSGLPSAITYPAIVNYQLPDFNQNICSSFQCSDVVLCVGQYVNRNNYIDVNGNLQTLAITEGALGASSSRGPTRDGRTKPDITSTGEVTMAALKLSSAAWFLANQPFKLAQGGMHIRDGGTSSAAPAVAGAIALYLQKNPTATWTDIRNRVMLCSKTDNFTGTNLPNNNWGHGKLDAFNMMIGCNALPVVETSKNNFLIYPNPANDYFTLQFSENKNVNQVELYNTLGQMIYNKRVTASDASIQIQLENIQKGIYIVLVCYENQESSKKTIVVE
ncbi:MAG: S8/S53 family peptidase [Bacteroidia bacterium]